MNNTRRGEGKFSISVETATTGPVPVGRSLASYRKHTTRLLRHHGACPRGALTALLPSRSVIAPLGQAQWSRGGGRWSNRAPARPLQLPDVQPVVKVALVREKPVPTALIRGRLTTTRRGDEQHEAGRLACANCQLGDIQPVVKVPLDPQIPVSNRFTRGGCTTPQTAHASVFEQRAASQSPRFRANVLVNQNSKERRKAARSAASNTNQHIIC